MATINRDIVTSFEDIEQVYLSNISPGCPERMLLIAVLERAFRDLNPEATSDDRRTAIAWFTSSPRKQKRRTGWTYAEIHDVLSLSASQVEYIAKAVRRAMQFEKFRKDFISESESEREADRTRLSGVAKREWYRVRPENKTVQRRRFV